MIINIIGAIVAIPLLFWLIPFMDRNILAATSRDRTLAERARGALKAASIVAVPYAIGTLLLVLEHARAS